MEKENYTCDKCKANCNSVVCFGEHEVCEDCFETLFFNPGSWKGND